MRNLKCIGCQEYYNCDCRDCTKGGFIGHIDICEKCASDENRCSVCAVELTGDMLWNEDSECCRDCAQDAAEMQYNF